MWEQVKMSEEQIKEEQTQSVEEKKTAEEKLYSDDNVDTSIYRCANCGGEAIFDAKSQKMVCQYCGSKFDLAESGKVEEKDLADLISHAKVWQEAEVYQCKSCGAKEIISNQDVAHECPFCGTNNIVKIEELPGLKPQGVVPFKMEKTKVSQIALNWAKKKFYAPRAFKKSAKPENIKGVYNPVFTFDAETKSTYSGQLGKNYTTTHIVNGRPVTQVHTRYFNISGRQDLNFDDYIVQASSNIPNATLVSISPFTTNGAPKYNQDYLRGYSASTYNKDGSTCWRECQTSMQKDIERKILSKYDYDVKSYLNVKYQLPSQKKSTGSP